MKRFQRAYPDLTVTIRSGHSKEVLEMVLGEQAEIGLARSLQHPEVETLSLRDDPLLLVVHSTKGPKHTRRARLAEVANWPLIFFDRGSSWRFFRNSRWGERFARIDSLPSKCWMRSRWAEAST